MEFHPDRYHENDATERMQEINEAYEILSDKEKRKSYDEDLSVPGASQGTRISVSRNNFDMFRISVQTSLKN